VFGVFKIKYLLFGLLLACPPVVAWMSHSRETRTHEPLSASATPVSVSPNSREMAKIPVEVVTKGQGTQTVYVSMPVQSVPEPGLLPLALVSALLLFRRKRVAGK
jgi:hypothetical protein